ncbi:MAG: MarR family winged helix-turn-helix transcriptional regulator [Candidatus Acidiferrales bacterium]
MDKKRGATRKEKKQRAWGAYLEITETAGWMERKLRLPLDVLGLTREEFRLLVMLYRDGPVTLSDATERLGRSRQNVHETIRRAEEFGWVSCGEKRLPAAEARESQLPKSRRGKERFGQRVVVASLTPQGEKLIGNVLPRQETIVKSLMHALDSRELDSVIRICRKLRRADALPYWAELMRQDREFGESAEAEDSGNG